MKNPRLSDLPTVVVTAVWVLSARVVLARGGFPGAIKRYTLQPEAAPARPAEPLTPAVRRAARVAARVVQMRVLGATCLPRSIAIARVVASRGARADIVLGVTQVEGFAAHAWVEAGGQRIDPSGYPDGVYQPAGRFRLAG
ncbi:MAG: lasso peptide biosynthesis B2 protein [Actinomycetota bacterium]